MLLIKATQGKTASWYWAGTILYWFAYTLDWRIDISWGRTGNIYPCISSRVNINYEWIASLAGCKLRTQAPEYQASLLQAAVWGELDTATSVKHEFLLATRYHTPSTTADRLNLASTYRYCYLYARHIETWFYTLAAGLKAIICKLSVGIRFRMQAR